MAEIIITVENISELREAFRRFPNIVAPFLRDANMKSALAIEGSAKEVTPVDTGRLRGSIATSLGVKDRGLSSIVQTNVFYAIFVHEGTSRAKGRPFMKQGVDKVIGRIEGYYKEAATRAMQEVANMT